MLRAIDYYTAHEADGDALLVGTPSMAFLWLSMKENALVLCDFDGCQEADVSQASVETLILDWLNDAAADPDTVNDIPHLNVTWENGRFFITE